MLVALLLSFVACKKTAPAEVRPDNVFYTCSMHPQVMEKKPGKCPICHMDLIQVESHPNQQAGQLILNDEQLRLANIQTDTMRLRPLGREITLSATLKENQNLVGVVTARISGRIERLFIRNTGEPVRVGQAIFELYSEPLAVAQQDYLLALQSKKRYADTDPTFTRIADAARNKLLLWGMSETQINEVEQSGQVKNTLTFYSKYAGVATEVSVGEGDYVAEGSPVLRLTDLRSLWAEAQFYVSDLPFLSQTNDALLEIPTFPERRLRGKVSFVNPALETSSKIIVVRTEIANPNGEYQPGMQVWMTLKDRTQNALAVPTNALIRGKDGSTVWLKNANGAFENRMVTVGKTNHDFVEITQGLQPNDVVVISGAYLLQSEIIFKKGASPMAGHNMGVGGNDHKGH